MRLRQCVFVAKDLESAAAELCDILSIEVAFRDPGVAKWGLVNVVCPVGHDFFEIITPFQDGTSAGRYIERRKGDGGYMVIFQVPDAAAERKRLTAMGVRTIAQKDVPGQIYTQYHPSDTAGVLLSLDTTFAPDGVDPALWWPPAEKDWLRHARADVTAGLAGVEIQHPEPAAAAALWSKLLNRPLDGARIRIDGAEIRFVPDRDGRGPGISAYDVRTVDKPRVLAAAERRGKKRGPAQIEVCGCRVNLV